mgnify:CR=1 FL=1
MQRLQYTILFIIINFCSLGIGSWLMGSGANSDWYLSLNKAPWTPPGWVFGVAWTTIMICFSIYLANLFLKSRNQKSLLLYTIQVVLNISWSYIFFNQQLILFGLVVICSLTLLIFYFFEYEKKVVKKSRLLLFPYMIWLLIATSLNAYIYFFNI